ncbi:LAMI_0F00672g1_1 [Lachancea mirantina]|uniref:Spindle pole body component KRE28 n=1 Tax=Lachancea mirantina TaxID=1230905 RepID=A0A1G4JVQ7_9SACH|nr:LAMI_0F00672g1_1 [Lachancea mirantina]
MSRTQLETLQDEVAILSENALSEQEKHFGDALDQLQESVRQLSENNELVVGSKNNGLIVDTSCIPQRIDDLSRLTDNLKELHLEQETLDNFLRYTMSIQDITQLEALDEAKIKILREEVRESEDATTKGLSEVIDALQNQISDVSGSITEGWENINEECLNATNILEECWSLLEELDAMKREQQKEAEAAAFKVDPITETYAAWKSMQEMAFHETRLKEQIAALSATKDALQQESRGKAEQSTSADVANKCQTLDLLSKFWTKNFLPEEADQLDVLLGNDYVQLRCYGVDVLLTYDGDVVTDLKIFGDMPQQNAAERAEREILNSVKDRNIKSALVHVLSGIKSYAKEISEKS